MSRKRTLVAMLAFTLVGCATSGTGEVRQSPNSNVITAEELRTAPQGNAWDVVQALRPQWLRMRSPTRAGADDQTVRVYVDEDGRGGLEALRAVSAAILVSLEYLDAEAASARFGVQHPNGAILVTTQRGGPIPPGASLRRE